MTRSLDLPPESELLALPRLDPKSIKAEIAARHYVAYEKALTAVYAGSSIRDAAKHYHVRRNTLMDVVAESVRYHPDGKLVGYRACLWHHRREKEHKEDPVVDANQPPKSIAALLRLVPGAVALLEAFRGRLPERNRSSRTFNKFFKKLFELISKAGWGDLPMWATPDRARRALIRRIRAARESLPTPDLDEESPEKTHGTRLEHLFPLKPFDRIEADGHRIDVNWNVLIQTPEGNWIPRLITRLWLIVFIDVASRVIVAWNLVVKDNYNRFDLLRTGARSLTRWQRRELIVPNMKYHPEAWMPNAVDTGSRILRGACLALDSAMAHIAKEATHNLAKFFGGVVNVGFPGVPEGRPHVEAFFKKIEEQVLRLLAGGFRPEGTNRDGPEATTALRAEDYPARLQALDDLIDVAVSGYHATPQAAMYEQSPRQVVEQYFDSAIGIHSTLTDEDAAELLMLRPRVTIAGKKKIRQPHVRWKKGTYRSRVLHGRYHLIGQAFQATVNANDLRRMTLWKDGQVFAVLHVSSPWARTAHDLETRERANACQKLGLISWKGVEDAVAAYHDAVRHWAHELRWAADEYVRSDLATSQSPKTHGDPPRIISIFDVPPRR
jgi:hypothetical protein